MKYEFSACIFKEGNRAFIRIPFNVREETGLKGKRHDGIQQKKVIYC